uniref:Paired mesoderm homeobox protein 2B (Trinotate prediction) n=1 Tax=Myxobolus squamalis TaxID=59785 RepID=A0A6B2G8Y2_MYXSQ
MEIHTLKSSSDSCNDGSKGFRNKERNDRKQRTKFDSAQLKQLENYFKFNRYPNAHDRVELSICLDVKEFVIQTWFKNKRARNKSSNNQQIFTENPLSYNSFPANEFNSQFYNPTPQLAASFYLSTHQPRENKKYFQDRPHAFRDISNSHNPINCYQNYVPPGNTDHFNFQNRQFWPPLQFMDDYYKNGNQKFQ